MAHFTRTQTDATWTNGGAEGYVLPRADLESLDAKQFKSINGDRGGTWRPSSPIVLIGEDDIVENNGAIRIVKTRIDYGGKLSFTDAMYPKLVAGNYPTFAVGHVARSRKILTPCAIARKSAEWHWILNTQYMALQSVACTVQSRESHFDLGWSINHPGDHFASTPTVFDGFSVTQPMFELPLRVHNGARMVAVTLSFRVPAQRREAPLKTPRVRVVRAKYDGTIEPLMSEEAGADANGFVDVPAATSASDWFADGKVQRLRYVCDQNHTMDVANYTYHLQVIEERGATEPQPNARVDGALLVERKVNVDYATTENIALTGAIMVDGHATPTNVRVLVKDQTKASENGIYVANSGGAWSRAADLDEPANFTPGALIYVAGGTTNGGTMWQLEAPFAASSPTLGVTPVSFRRRQPNGNIYHAAVCEFDSIVDMRPQ